jgi:hypothetical protein
MLFAIPPSVPPTEPQIMLVQDAPLSAEFHHDRLTFGAPTVWSLKGNPKALLDDQSFQLPKTQQP